MKILFFSFNKVIVHSESPCAKNKTGKNQNCPSKSIVEVLNLRIIISLSKKSLIDSTGVLLNPH